jgi:hypothetical protein
MQIPGTLLGGLLSGVIGQATRSPEHNSQAKTEPTDGTTASESLNTLLARSGVQSLGQEILKSYDVTHITPRQFSEMLQKLRESGVISEEEYLDLTQIRRDLTDAGIEADEPVDLLDFYQKLMRKLQLMLSLASTESVDEIQQTLQRAEKHLEWLEKVSTQQLESGTDIWA